MQSGHRNVDEMKYTIANITMNILVSLFNQAARMSPSSIRRGWRWGPQPEEVRHPCALRHFFLHSTAESKVTPREQY